MHGWLYERTWSVSQGMYMATVLCPAIMSSFLLLVLILGLLFVSNVLCGVAKFIVPTENDASFCHASKYSTWAKSFLWRAFLAFLEDMDRETLSKKEVGPNDLEQVPFFLAVKYGMVMILS